MSTHPDKAYAITSLGKRRYYSALKYATAVVGNSSSGLVEAPSFHIPTLNIGDRQQGRTRGESVIDVDATYEGIRDGLNRALSLEFINLAKNAKNPYEKENTLQEIFNTIKTYPLENLIKKHFYDL